ncbi:MAG TPA: YggU family protein [Candidatus Atribacteria bacterium]|nr:YggU family protein [Candidatus Atribacteria bacterium]
MKNIKQGIIKVILKPNSTKNRIIKFDSEKNAYRIEIKAPAQENKANLELIKFLSRSLKKDVKIIKGLKSKEKLIKISQRK